MKKNALTALFLTGLTISFFGLALADEFQCEILNLKGTVTVYDA